MIRMILAVVGLLVCGSTHAIPTVRCDLTAVRTTYVPTQPWPFDTISVVAAWAPQCFNFSCLPPPALVGAIAQVVGADILVDLYGSEGAPLPPGVVPFPPIQGAYAQAQTVVAAIPPGEYTLRTRAIAVDANGSQEVCRYLPADTKVRITAAHGPVALLPAVEYYNAFLDHYFVTARPQEIRDLDDGVHRGWLRTGLGFNVFGSGMSGGVGMPVCRFYGDPSAGLDSHFYTSDKVECGALPGKFGGAWKLESSAVFDVWPTERGGECEPGFLKVYRLWNQRADSNHRYTTDFDVAREMRSRGYFWEGAGMGVAMCAPQ